MTKILRGYLRTAAIVLLSLLCILPGCAGQPGSVKTAELAEVQIKDYDGERLSPVSDFHENSIKGPQHVNQDEYRLKITGLAVQPLSYTYDEVISTYKSYRKLVTLDCVEGWSVKILWEGLLVKDLLTEAGMQPAASVVIFHAHDGYTTSLPLQYILDNNILLAYKMNGVTIPPERGYPFQLVAEQRWGYKWIKWVTEIELSADVNYRGYWEKAGYSNDGALDKPFFDK